MDIASTSFILGYHGCDLAVAEGVFFGDKKLLPSKNDYDWLGHGIYFWEHNALRAYHKNHIQICIRNPDCIKGYFRPYS